MKTLLACLAIIGCGPSSEVLGTGLSTTRTTTSSSTTTTVLPDCATEAQPVFLPDYTPVSRFIAAIDLDPLAGATTDREHMVMLPTEGASRDLLFVLLTGTGSAPSAAMQMPSTAAFLGYRVISLDYVSTPSISDLCGNDPVCDEDVLLERIYGQDRHDGLVVDPPNSVIRRLRTLLTHLSQTYPTEGWHGYLDADNQIRWDQIVLSGGSQGGKTAAFISRDHQVARAILHSAMGSAYQEQAGTPVVAPWSLEPRATPAEDTYGIWHAQESSNRYAPLILESYGVDLFGDVVDVDNTAPPYGCTHQLRTDLEPSSGDCGDAHPSMGLDGLIALDDDGVARLAPAWIYLASAGWYPD